MPGPTNTLLIEGSFEELADELAQYIDGVKKSQGDESSNLQAEIAPLSEQRQKDEVLKKIVTAGAILNAAPEKGMLPSRERKTELTSCRIHRSIQSPRPPHPTITKFR